MNRAFIETKPFLNERSAMTSLKKYDVSYTKKIVSMWCYPLFQSIWIGPILETEIAIFCFSIFWVVLFFIFSGREKASIFIRMFLSCYRAAHMYYPSWLRYWARKSTKHHKKQGRDVSHIFLLWNTSPLSYFRTSSYFRILFKRHFNFLGIYNTALPTLKVMERLIFFCADLIPFFFCFFRRTTCSFKFTTFFFFPW